MFILPLLFTAVLALLALTGGAPGFLASSLGTLSVEGLVDTLLFILGSASTASTISAPKIINALDAAFASVNTDLALFDPRLVSLAVVNVVPPGTCKAALNIAAKAWVRQFRVVALGFFSVLLVAAHLFVLYLVYLAISFLFTRGVSSLVKSLFRAQTYNAHPKISARWSIYTADHTIILDLTHDNSHLFACLLSPSSLVPEGPLDITSLVSPGAATLADIDYYPAYEPTLHGRLNWHDASVYLFSTRGYAKAYIIPYDTTLRPKIVYGRLARLDSGDTAYPTQLYFRPTCEVRNLNTTTINDYLEDRGCTTSSQLDELLRHLGKLKKPPALEHG